MSTNDVWRQPRIAPTRKDLRNVQNKSEGVPTSGRSTNYGSAHLIPIFRGIERTFSRLLPKCLDAAIKA
jgi:hypothetical protein